MNTGSQYNWWKDEGAREKALDILSDIVGNAEIDEITREVILAGDWGNNHSVSEERFRSFDEIQEFLETFGWKRDGNDMSFGPNASVSILDEGEADFLVEFLIEEHKIADLFPSQSEFNSNNKLFDFRQLAKNQVVQDVGIELVTANEQLIRQLAVDPKLMYELNPRRLEEIVAEIFEAMGFEVVLTPRTRDGGYDIRAVRNNSLGTFLYLVECKRYAPNRPVGVELVRSLYGTVREQRATHGVLATTSYFTRDAGQFASKLQYQLSLRDYENLQSWIEEYINSERRIII